MVGSGTGVDEEAVKRDLEIMEDVDKEDARALLQWCEERSLREELENFPKDGDLSNLGKRSGQLSNSVFFCDQRHRWLYGDEAEAAAVEATGRYLYQNRHFFESLSGKD